MNMMCEYCHGGGCFQCPEMTPPPVTVLHKREPKWLETEIGPKPDTGQTLREALHNSGMDAGDVMAAYLFVRGFIAKKFGNALVESMGTKDNKVMTEIDIIELYQELIK